jgi:hypothetical protein
MNVREITIAAQDNVITVVETTQAWVLDALATTSSTFDTYRPEAPPLSLFEQLPSPTELIDLSFSFLERLLDAEHAFLTRLVETWSPPSSPEAPSSAEAPGT